MFGKKEEQVDSSFYTIYDTKSGSYRDPIISKDPAEIIRQLESNFLNPAMAYDQYVTHAEDFQLFKLATFNRKTGLINATQPEHVVNLNELKSAALAKARALSPT